MSCIICGGKKGQVYREEFQQFQTVTSDCRPFGAGGELLLCSFCDTVYRPRTNQWRANCRKIYSNYVAHRQGHGDEQKLFESSSSISRSAKLVDQLLRIEFLSDNLTWLDFGCGEGHFLRELENASKNCRLYGCDFGQTPPDRFQPSTRKKYFPIDSRPRLRFDRISLIHVAEHFFNPVQELKEIKKMLKPNAKLFIQIPYLKENPLDLIIADHGTFFTKDTIQSLLLRSGYKIEQISADWVRKELSIVVSIADKSPTSPQSRCEGVGGKESSLSILKTHYRYLSDLKDEIASKRGGGGLIIFGSSIGATWGAAESGLENVEAFFDEDSARWGFDHLGIPILNPKRNIQNVVIPLDAGTREKIKNKYNF